MTSFATFILFSSSVFLCTHYFCKKRNNMVPRLEGPGVPGPKRCVILSFLSTKSENSTMFCCLIECQGVTFHTMPVRVNRIPKLRSCMYCMSTFLHHLLHVVAPGTNYLLHLCSLKIITIEATEKRIWVLRDNLDCSFRIFFCCKRTCRVMIWFTF